MCRPVPCSKCGKTTWAGCGRHVDAVKSSVPAARWCLCPREAGVTSPAPSFPSSPVLSHRPIPESSSRKASPGGVSMVPPFRDVLQGPESKWHLLPNGRLEEAERWVQHFAPLDMREELITSGLLGRLKKAIFAQKKSGRAAVIRTPDMSEKSSTNLSPFASSPAGRTSCRASDLEILQAGGRRPRSGSPSTWGSAALVVAVSSLAFVGSVVTVMA